MTDDRFATAWWADLERGWKAVLIGLLMTIAVQFWHAGLAGVPLG